MDMDEIVEGGRGGDGGWSNVRPNRLIYSCWEPKRAGQISRRGFQMWPALSACVISQTGKIKGEQSLPSHPLHPPSGTPQQGPASVHQSVLLPPLPSLCS